MSTTNRNKVLFGFGALVAVLIVAIIMWPTNVQREDATGAIGAVQKHRAPQITPQDVVLGNEEVKHQQKVLYADFLADAAKLRAIGSSQKADLAALGAFRDDINVRYNQELDAALADLDALASRAPAADRARALRDIGAIRDRFPGRGRHLNALGMQQVNNALKAIGLRDENAETRIAEARALFSKIDFNKEAAAKQVEDVDVMLSHLYAATLADEEAYADELTLEMKTLEDENAAASRIKLADELESSAKANMEKNAREDENISNALRALGDDVQAQARVYSTAAMVNSHALLNSNLNALGMMLQRNQALAKSQAESIKQFEARNSD
jgi:hypothetical protein